MDRLARIRSYGARFWSKVKIGDGCWEWQASRTVGCGQMFAGDTTRTGGKRMTHAHRMSWMLMYGDIILKYALPGSVRSTMPSFHQRLNAHLLDALQCHAM
jgi:hypothetical protein